MADGPTVMAFLFTDVERSTRLWERHPGTMSAALRVHDQVLRESIEAAEGVVFSTAGDSFAAAFPSAAYALSAAVEGQRALRELDVEGEPLRVRMAVHLGPAERRGGDFFGPTLNRCARLMAAGHGGQILISSAVAESHPTLLSGASLLDLGEHRLKDLGYPERIYQLVHPDLILNFSALRTLEAYRTNLPTFETSFVGREREMADLLAAVGQHRLVTLTGSGGSGKTRLAAQMAAELLDRFPEGLWFVDLLATNHSQGVSACFLSTVKPAHGRAEDELGAVEETLRDRRALLIVDNCEHVVDETARVINRLLTGCPHLRILATSRQPIGVAGEQVRPVQPLAVPAEDEIAGGLALVREASAIQLLVERARSVDPSFRVDAANAKAAVSLCRHLDGLPLAIELAVARLRTMSLDDVATRIDRRFRLLTTPWDRTTVRHQTLRAAIDWSFDLLSPEHALFLRRVGVFEGSFAVRAAEACGVPPLDPRDVAGILSDLVDQSLVVRVHGVTGSRYRLLETIRAYARERASIDPGDVEAIRRAHAQFYRQRVEGIEAQLYGHGQAQLLTELTDDLPDLRAAVDFWEGRDPVTALSMVADLGPFWFMQGRGREAVARLSPLRQTASEAPPPLLARARFEEAQAAWSIGKRDQAETLCREAIVMFSEQGDDVGKARSLSLLGRIVLDRNGDEAESVLQEASELAAQAGAPRWAADALHFLGILRGRRGDRRSAFRLHRRSRQAFLAAGDAIGATYSLGAAGVDLWVLGRRAVALKCFEKAQNAHLTSGERRALAEGHSVLALFHLVLAEPSEARRQTTRALELARETCSPAAMLTALWAAAALIWQFGEPDLARRCLHLRGSLPEGNSLFDSLRLDPALSPLESLEPWGDDAASDTVIDEALALLEDVSQTLPA